MSTSATSDTPAGDTAAGDTAAGLSSTRRSQTSAEDREGHSAAAAVPRLWDRIGEAVRAAHAASVPF